MAVAYQADRKKERIVETSSLVLVSAHACLNECFARGNPPSTPVSAHLPAAQPAPCPFAGIYCGTCSLSSAFSSRDSLPNSSYVMTIQPSSSRCSHHSLGFGQVMTGKPAATLVLSFSSVFVAPSSRKASPAESVMMVLTAARSDVMEGYVASISRSFACNLPIIVRISAFEQ